MIKKILVTGGAGYIGSHTCVALLNDDYEVVVVDNLCNSKEESIRRIGKITSKKVTFYKADVCDEKAIDDIFKKEKVDAVIHFAGLKAVGESVDKPLEYYKNNLDSTLSLLKGMINNHVDNIVFSSSATVYGMSDDVPFYETSPVMEATNPYGDTKIIIERILKWTQNAHKNLNVALLRYFNPIGAHESGLIGENPNGIPNNLMPYITQVAVGKLDHVRVWGNDYPTVDGTGVRDYIHVVDLASGHIAALKKLEEKPGCFICNLGTGKGTSVIELIHAFEKANNLTIPYKVYGRRNGDIATCYANVDFAKKYLGWEAKKDIVDCCRDSWKWQKNNPNGL